jgi:hypothetical protein
MSAAAQHTFRLNEPQFAERSVTFSWDTEPRSELYLRNDFTLTFPPELDLHAVPRALWMRLAILCLHPHWALLRPCRVELPVYLGPAEREFWLRLIDITALQIEAYGGATGERRAVELYDDGPAAAPVPVRAGDDRAVGAFSGGKDSLVQSALLAELVDRPLLVTTSSPVGWANDHTNAARSRTLAQIADRLPVTLVEVQSDFRSCWDNGYSIRQGTLLTVNELCDVLLYQAVAVAAAAASGISRSFLASEADLQYNASRRGNVILHGHFASAAVVQSAVDVVLSPFGLHLSSLTYPLHMQHVEALLWRRYRHLADLQVSCWQATGASQACSRCSQCLEVALVILDEGFSPRVAGIDPAEVICAFAEPQRDPRVERRPPLHPNRSGNDKITRILQRTPPERIASMLSADGVEAGRLDSVLDAYSKLRARAFERFALPDPGYIGGFLEMIDPKLRDGVRRIFDQYFEPADEREYAPTVGRARSLARWIAAPLLRDPARQAAGR